MKNTHFNAVVTGDALALPVEPFWTNTESLRSKKTVSVFTTVFVLYAAI